MAVIPCKEAIDCPGSDFPITNYSAEGPEQQPTFFSVVFPREWDKFGCLSLCTSTISQNDADLCALAQEAFCHPNNPVQFCSTAQTCSCESYGGSEFFYTTPAGTFCADTQEAADALAHAYACDHCGDPNTSTQIVGIDACTCFGAPYTTLIAFTGQRPISWIITDGFLPPGLILNSSNGQISGTPTSTGTFVFTIRAFNRDGNYATKTMSIAVIAISTTALPDFEFGVPYSFQMRAVGGSGNYAWKVSAGALPNGLTMSSTGLISGTPT